MRSIGTYSAPVTIVEGDVQILGAPVEVGVDDAGDHLHDGVRPSDVAGTFAFVDLPTFALTASLDTNQEIPIEFGFADGDQRPATSASTSQSPSGSAIPTASTASRWTSSATVAIDDLVQLDFPDNGTDDIDIDLALNADVFGTEFGGQLTINDENFFSDPAATFDFSATGANPIDLLSNISADTAITSLAQLVSSYGAAMLAGDVKLPFLSDGVFIPGDLGAADLSDFDRVFRGDPATGRLRDAPIVRPDRVRHRGRARIRTARVASRASRPATSSTSPRTSRCSAGPTRQSTDPRSGRSAARMPEQPARRPSARTRRRTSS